MTNSSMNASIIPDGEERCVWMNAGLTSYQLCNRSFECSDCPVEEAMRARYSRPLPQAAHSPLSKLAEKNDLAASYLYTKDHWWVRRLENHGDHYYRLGLEPLLAQLIAYPKEFVLPQAGSTIEARSFCAWIVLKGGTVPLRSPVGGTVSRINREVLNSPCNVVNDPCGSGWLLEITSTNEAAEQMMERHQAHIHYAKEKERLTMLLSNSLRKAAPDVGVTLADGGSFAANLGDIIGQKKLFSIIMEMISV